MENTKQILSMMLLTGVPGIVQASACDGSDQFPVKESTIENRIYPNPEDSKCSKQQFLMHLERIACFAKKDNAVGQQTAKTNDGERRNENGRFCFTIKTDLLENFTVNLVRAIAPLIEFGTELKWQIDEECTGRLFETFKVVMQPWKNVTVDRLDLRGQWVLQSISALDGKREYFTPKAWELWEKCVINLKKIRPRELLGEYLRKLGQLFRSFYAMSNLSEEECQKSVSLIRKARDLVWEMRESKIEDAVTRYEFMDLLDAFSQAFPGYYISPISERKKAKRDLLYKSGVLTAFMDLITSIHPIRHFIMDKDVNGNWELTDPKTNQKIDMVFGLGDNGEKFTRCLLQSFFSPNDRDNPQLAQMQTTTGDLSQDLLTDELYEWCTKGTGEVHSVMQSPWVKWLVYEALDAILGHEE